MAKNRVEHDTKVSKEVLVRHVINDILNGATYSVLHAKLVEGLYCPNQDDEEQVKLYSRSSFNAARLISEARRRIKADTDEMIKHKREDAINRALDVYTECRELGDRMNAIKALDQINKLTGVYEHNINVKGQLDSNIIISFGLNNNEDEDEGNE